MGGRLAKNGSNSPFSVPSLGLPTGLSVLKDAGNFFFGRGLILRGVVLTSAVGETCSFEILDSTGVVVEKLVDFGVEVRTSGVFTLAGGDFFFGGGFVLRGVVLALDVGGTYSAESLESPERVDELDDFTLAGRDFFSTRGLFRGLRVLPAVVAVTFSSALLDASSVVLTGLVKPGPEAGSNGTSDGTSDGFALAG
jgi:hypothetical protein